MYREGTHSQGDGVPCLLLLGRASMQETTFHLATGRKANVCSIPPCKNYKQLHLKPTKLKIEKEIKHSGVTWGSIMKMRKGNTWLLREEDLMTVL